jgi:exonuclease SbcC
LRLERLELENFRSYEKLDLDLAALTSAAIVGPNGAGKSTLLTAIDYALYGGHADELLARSERRGGVTLTLSGDDGTWRVARGRERERRSWLVIEHDGKALDTHTVKDGQQVIEQAITGMDAEAFRASVYAAQGQAGMLASLSPRERKALLGSLLGLTRYEEWREAAAGDAREVSARREGQERRRAEIADELAEAEATLTGDDTLDADLEKNQKWLEDLEGEQAAASEREKIAVKVEQRRRIVAQMAELKRRGDEEKERRRQREALQEEVESLAGSADQLQGLEEARSEHLAAVAVVEQHRDALSAARGRVEGEKARAGRLVEALDAARARIPDTDAEDATCPTCGQLLTANSRALAQARKEAETQIGRIEADLEEVHGKADAAEAEVEELKRREMAESNGFDDDAYQAAKTADRRRAGLLGRIEGLADKEDLDALRAQHAELRAEAEELPEEIPEGRRVEDVRREEAAARAERSDLERRRTNRDTVRKRVKTLHDAAKLVEVDLAREGRRERALGVLVRAFSRNGIPAMILDNAVGGLESHANELLETLGVAMRVTLRTQAEKKGGGLKETLDIVVDDGQFERDLASFSGGEQYRVHVALRLALARTLAAGSGRTLDFLLIDEVTDLDAGGVEVLAELLARMPQQVLLVTHQDQLVDSMPERLAVERTAGVGSVVDR